MLALVAPTEATQYYVHEIFSLLFHACSLFTFLLLRRQRLLALNENLAFVLFLLIFLIFNFHLITFTPSPSLTCMRETFFCQALTCKSTSFSSLFYTDSCTSSSSELLHVSQHPSGRWKLLCLF